MNHSLLLFPSYLLSGLQIIAMAALYLACKVEDQPRQFEDIRETFLQTALNCHGVAYAAVNHEVLHPVYSP